MQFNVLDAFQTAQGANQVRAVNPLDQGHTETEFESGPLLRELRGHFFAGTQELAEHGPGNGLEIMSQPETDGEFQFVKHAWPPWAA